MQCKRTHISQRNIAFLFGGPGSEHEVSCATAQSAMSQFADGYVIKPVFITREGQWILANDYVPAHDAWGLAQQLVVQTGLPQEIALDAIEKDAPYIVFIGLHGEYGEDGTVQALLEARGLPFTGSDSIASALAIDKPAVLQLLQNEGIAVPDFLELTTELSQDDILSFTGFYGYPIVVLPADQGSSVGVTIADTQDELLAGIDRAKAISKRVLLSRYIVGQEISCGVLLTDHNVLTALPPTELRVSHGHRFFDYESKYTAGEVEEVTPARLPAEVIESIQLTAKQVHRLIGADGYSRTDMVVAPDNTVYVLEINTLPGLTPTSLLPQQAQAAGISFSALLDTICRFAHRATRDHRTITVARDSDE